MFFFSENNTDLTFKPISLECAYLLILQNDLEGASKIFRTIDSPRGKWGQLLIEILNGYTEVVPTYFAIRNFLEIDLDFLLKNNKINYVEQLLGAIDFFAEINQESYKFVARVMYENKLYNAAKKYLDKSKNVFYKDPELHFMYAKYFINSREYTYANYHIDECLKILPDYYPAKKLKTEICEYLR